MANNEPLSDKAFPLLEVRNLRVGFERGDGSGRIAAAVDGVSFSVRKGGTLCLVGESGCGKSVTALSILSLLPFPPAKRLGGEVFFEGTELTTLPERELNRLRGARIGMVFQDPMTSLNPVLRIGDQIAETLRIHRNVSKEEGLEAAVELLRRVGIDSPESRVRGYPHQLSGGMRQRVMIAMALACEPALIIADEPTTALDVTVQKQILELMRELIVDSGSGLLLITHDLGVVSHVADDVAVMYAGHIVEQGPAKEVLSSPNHPYTTGLLNSLPNISAKGAPRKTRLGAIPGTVPDLWNKPEGCPFHPRCPHAFERCRSELPPLSPLGTPAAFEAFPRLSRCWL